MRAPLRITQVSFVTDAHRRSGRELLEAWPTLPAVARASANAGASVNVVQPAHCNEEFMEDGVHYRFATSNIAQAVRDTNPDVVHVQGLNTPQAVARLTREMRNVPVVVQDHGGRVPSGLQRWSVRRGYAGIAAVLFTAAEQAEPWKSKGALRNTLPVLEVLEMSSAFTPGDRAAAREKTGMFGDPCMLWVGRLDANKDPLTVLAAFERAAPQLPNARLWCCYGESPLLRDVQRRIASSGILRNRVELLGTRPHAELELRYRAADFLVQGSLHEGSGYSVIEALACGTTPLVTDIPSLRRIVGNAGALARTRNVDAFVEAMLSWSRRDRTERRTLAREQFERRLSFEVLGSELLDAYRSVVDRALLAAALS